MPGSARGSSRGGLGSARGASRGGPASARGSVRDRLPTVDQNAALVVDGQSAHHDLNLGQEFAVDPSQHRLAQAALEKRGNVKDLEDANRVYSAAEQKKWEQKYKFFSNRGMEKSYKVFARARHDPFNKDPSWGKSILKKVGSACDSRGVRPEELFTGVDITGDGNLNRPEMKKVILSVLPSMSDQELVAIFDTIDEDHSGEVNVEEFLTVLKSGMAAAGDPEEAKWRNPVHRTKRFAPAEIEGWSHLEGPPQFNRLEHLVATQQQSMHTRLMEPMAKSSPAGGRPLTSGAPSCSDSKYHFFVGGGDAERFRRQKWQKEMRKAEASGTVDDFRSCRLTDPGPIPRPGWMYNSELREVVLAGATSQRQGVANTAWILPRTPLSARAATALPSTR